MVVPDQWKKVQVIVTHNDLSFVRKIWKVIVHNKGGYRNQNDEVFDLEIFWSMSKFFFVEIFILDFFVLTLFPFSSFSLNL